MDSRLNAATAVSLIIHSAILLPLCDIASFREKEAQKRPIKVDYIVIKEASRETVSIKVEETPKVEVAKAVEVKPPVSAARPPARKEAPQAAQDAARQEARIKSTKDYINYYQLIREKIRQRLKYNYRSYYKEGDVQLTFALARDGALAAFHVEDAQSNRDATLRGIACLSLREAAPFPPFPRALDLPTMSFSVTISFKKR